VTPVRDDDRFHLRRGFLEQLDFSRGDLVIGRRCVILWPDDYRPVTSIVDLATAVGVIEVAAVLAGTPLVLVALTRLDGSLGETRDTVRPGSVLLVNA
jgi:hypothetical protein